MLLLLAVAVAAVVAGVCGLFCFSDAHTAFGAALVVVNVVAAIWVY